MQKLGPALAWGRSRDAGRLEGCPSLRIVVASKAVVVRSDPEGDLVSIEAREGKDLSLEPRAPQDNANMLDLAAAALYTVDRRLDN